MHGRSLTEQSAYRSHAARRQHGRSLTAAFDASMAQLPTQPDLLVAATRQLAFGFVDGAAGDVQRLAAWCRYVVTGSTPTPLFATMIGPDAARWTALLQRIGGILAQQIGRHARAPSSLLFLEVLKQLLDPARYPRGSHASAAGLARSLVARGRLYERIADHIASFPSERKGSTPTLSSAATLALLPLNALAGDAEAKTAAIEAFVGRLLVVPSLATRLPPNAATALGTKAPIVDILAVFTASPAETLARLAPEPSQAASLLANVLALFDRRVSEFAKADGFVNYLRLLKACLDVLPAGALAETRSADAMDVDGAVSMPNPLARLYAPTSLHALMAASARFSANPHSRPVFCAFLVSLLYSLPRAARDDVVGLLVYDGNSATGSRGQSQSGGLLRELWRGYIRSGALGRTIGGGKEGWSRVPAALADPTFSEAWPILILMIELYSRSLLTLGDDEFFSSSSASRNPLAVDEVVGFSALLRNIAFSLYWQEGLTDESASQLAGTHMHLADLRALTTRVLHQIYDRDSRKRFTPDEHFTMTQTFDVGAFLKTAMAQSAEVESGPAAPTNFRVLEEDSDEDEEQFLANRRRANLLRALGKGKGKGKAPAGPSRHELLLNELPFVLPFETRVAVFREWLRIDREKLGLAPSFFHRGGARQRAVIRRGHVADDGFATLAGLGPALKGRLEIQFVDEFGLEEAGIDGGGLFKEFLTALSREAFDTDRGLWRTNQARELYPAPHAYATDTRSLAWFTFLGRIIGKAIYDQILVDVPFANFFLSKWLGRQSFFDDLASLDPELYGGLVKLKTYDGDVADLSLTFSVDDEEFGQAVTRDLIPGGRDITVTRETRFRYITLMAHFRLNAQLRAQCSAFVTGLHEIIDPRWLRLFSPAELRSLVGGAEEPIDIEDLRRNTVYAHTMDEASTTVRHFWRVVNSFDDKHRKQLLRFVTSCERPPLLGFSELYPRFSLTSGGDDEERLPSASTCVNLMKLPQYSTEAKLREKLVAAITSGARFDLS